MNAPIIAYRANMGVQTAAPFLNTYSLDFDGTDDRVQLSSDFVASGEFTLSFWMKPVAVTGNGNIFPIGTFPDNQNHVRLDQIGVIYLKVQAVLCLFNEGVVGGGDNNLVLNEWQHISFIRDSSNIITCYRNGAIFGATVTNSGTLTLNSIGRVIANTFGFQGGLDEIAFWNTDETANIATLSASPTEDLTSLSPTIWLRNGDNGSYKSPQWLLSNNENKDKVSNYSFEFDGISDYINIGNGISFEYTDAFSFSTWVKPLAKSGVKYLYSKYIGGKGILIYLNSSGSSGNNTLHFNLYNTVSGTPASRKWITTNVLALLSVNDWANIIITYDGSGLGSGISFYKNGIAQTVSVTYDNLQNNSIVNTEDAYLSSYNGTSSFLSGNQDEFSIFNTELSSGDALSIYNSGTPTTLPSGAVAHYKLGEEATFSGGVWTVPDAVGSNNGISNAMTIEDRIGEAPNSTDNALSYNMDLVDRVTDTP